MNFVEFANPSGWWWALLAIPIVLLYILKIRLRRQAVSTLLFWDQLFDAKKPRSWWQRLRHLSSLLLQLAFLLLLVGSLVVPLEFEPGATVTRILDHTSPSGGCLIATLDVEDALATDNTAVVVRPKCVPFPVVLVTDGNLFLKSVFEAMPLVDLQIVADPPSAAPAKGILVLDRKTPEQLPLGRLIVVDPRSGCDAWTLGETISQPMVASVDADSPLTQHVRLDNILFPDARLLQFVSDFEPLIQDPLDQPLLARLRRPAGDAIVLTCSLEKGDLPLRIAFPVLMKNAIEWWLYQRRIVG